MGHQTLDNFIDTNRSELIRRCRAKVAVRSDPMPTVAEMNLGVPLFLDQLVEEMRGPSQTREISDAAIQHGYNLFLHGFSISEVVHDYGDVCQSITDLAVERQAPLSTDDFRTLNRCLDDAIAGAVTEYARQQDVPSLGELHQLESLINGAITAFDVLRTGTVGVTGSTGSVVYRNLMAIRAAVTCRLGAEVTPVPALDETRIRSVPEHPSCAADD